MRVTTVAFDDALSHQVTTDQIVTFHCCWHGNGRAPVPWKRQLERRSLDLCLCAVAWQCGQKRARQSEPIRA
jgi:hypothetical protein